MSICIQMFNVHAIEADVWLDWWQEKPTDIVPFFQSKKSNKHDFEQIFCKLEKLAEYYINNLVEIVKSGIYMLRLEAWR